jgi:DNA-binding NarL/FixJ family response regulator
VQSLASSTVVALLLGLAAWRIGSTLRARLDSHAQISPPVVSGSDGETAHEELSRREAEIYRLIVSGMSNREIATAANIEESTVKSHVSSVLAKLGVNSRAQLIARDRSTAHQ